MWQKRIKILGPISIVLSMLSVNAFANREAWISGENGEQTYGVVIEDAQAGASQRVPGIYTMRRTEESATPEPHLLLPGQLAFKEEGLMILPLPTSDARRPAVGVLDGKVVVFHRFSTIEDRSSFVVLGSVEHPAQHIWTAEEVEVPEIRSSEDYELYARRLSTREVLLLVSLRTQSGELGAARTGQTFYAVLETQGEGVNTPLSLKEPFRLIDDRFLTKTMLEELVKETTDVDLELDSDSDPFPDFAIYSRLALQGLVRARRSEPAFVQEWKQMMRRYLDPTLFTNQLLQEPGFLPFVETTGKEVIVHAPHLEMDIGRGLPTVFVLKQNYSLTGGGHELEILSSSETRLHGLIREDDNGEPRVFVHETESEALFEFNDSVYWVSRDQALELPSIFKLEGATDVTFFKPERQQYLLVSYKKAGDAFTMVVFLPENLVSTAEVAEINHRHYSFEELEERLVLSNSGPNVAPIFILDGLEGRTEDSPEIGVELRRGQVGKFLRFADRETYNKDLGVGLIFSSTGSVILRDQKLNERTGRLIEDSEISTRTILTAMRTGLPPEDVGFHAILDPRGDSLRRIILISLLRRNLENELEGLTIFLELKQEEGATRVVGDRIHSLVSTFYSSRELAMRTKTMGGSAVFDYQTPAGLEMTADYYNTYDEAALHLDLLDQGHQRYVAPQVDFAVGPFRFVVFGSDDHVGAQSGVYKPVEAGSQSLGHRLFAGVPVETKIVYPPSMGRGGRPLPAMHSSVVVSQSGKTIGERKNDHSLTRSLNVSALAVRPLGSGGGDQLMLFASVGTSEARVEPQTLRLARLPFAPGHITAATIIWERARESLTADANADISGYLLVATQEGELKEDAKVFVQQVRLHYDYVTGKDGEESLQLLDQDPFRLVAEGEVFSSAKELVERVVQDQRSGKPFWVVNGEIAVQNIDYTIAALQNPNEILKPFDPNRTEEVRGYSFPWEDVAKRTGIGSVSAAWLIYNENSNKPVIRNVQRAGLDSFSQRSLYPELMEIMNRIARAEHTPQHRVIVVPKELKSYVWNLLVARWLLGVEGTSGWSVNNPNLGLYIVDEDRKRQQDILMQLDALRLGRVQRQPVVLADLATVKAIGSPAYQAHDERKGRKPENEPSKFQISLDAEIIAEGGADGGSMEVDQRVRVEMPSLFYLLQTEGERLSPSQVVSNPPVPRVPMVFVATEEELRSVSDVSRPEMAEVLQNNLVEMRLNYPSEETRIDLFIESIKKAGLLDRFEWSAEGLQPGAENWDRDAQVAAFARWAVNRVDRLAEKHGDKDSERRGKLEYFSDFLIRFIEESSKDVLLRRTRRIDPRYVERLLVPLFNLPPSVDALPEDDYLVQVSRRENDVILRWQTGVNPQGVRHPLERGYDGAFEIKREILERIRSQTTSNDAKSMVGSFIFVGETGSGKTWLWDSLMYVLGFKVITLDQTDEEFGNYLRIDCRNFDAHGGGDDRGAGGRLTLRQLRELFDRALMSAHGPRLSILLDDLHEAPEEFRDFLLEKVSELTNNTKVLVGSGASVRPVPTRNILLAITMNPTSDLEKIRKVAGNSYLSPTVDQVITATLSTQSHQFAESSLRRFGTPILIEKFGGSTLALIDELGKNALQEFEFNNRLTLFMPSATGLLSREYSGLDARTYLSELPNALMQFATHASHEFAAPLVIPKVRSTREGGRDVLYESYLEDRKGSSQMRFGMMRGRRGDEQVRTSTIQRFVSENMDVVDTLNPIVGTPYLLRLMLDGFRNRVFEAVVSNVQANPDYALSGTGVDLGSMLAAFGGHLVENPTLPIRELQLNLRNFKLRNDSERERLREQFREIDARNGVEGRYFPIDFEPESLSVIRSILGEEQLPNEADRLREVLNQHTRSLIDIFERHLAGFLKVQDVERFPDVASWVHELSPEEYPDYQRLGEELMEAFGAFFDEAAVQASRVEGAQYLNWYDWGRIYSYLLDRAIARLPWSKTTVFMQDVLREIRRDRSIAEKRSVLHFLFSSKTTLIRPSTSDVALQMVFGSRAIQEDYIQRGGTEGGSRFVRDRELFLSACERVFKK